MPALKKKVELTISVYRTEEFGHCSYKECPKSTTLKVSCDTWAAVFDKYLCNEHAVLMTGHLVDCV